jgi:hypothetical protein
LARKEPKVVFFSADQDADFNGDGAVNATATASAIAAANR